ncbi:MAG: hypothetical protein Ta2F_18240 [Termitinemataceae bacterium]|nr:MAG: hypothetical protein Ta2F_18240 [Termitinemataceae bacterium]
MYYENEFIDKIEKEISIPKEKYAEIQVKNVSKMLDDRKDNTCLRQVNVN